MNKLTKEQEIIKLIFKDFLTHYNSRSISKPINISRVWAFKVFKNLEKREIVKSEKIGNAIIYSLNLDNPVTHKEIELILIIEAENFRRWKEEFKELEKKVNFLILFGSITRNEKTARDIDLLIVANSKKLKEIEKIIEKLQRYTSKKIHPLIQTMKDFKKDLNKKNKTIIDIIKTGIVLFGQEEFRKALK
ncbi:MAG: nucleotidyltransferase domain-containing protein [Nanoarchaeota archaeon]|nr:nucleotidyltransferase domain-containing protein [Nanoarchaeota archaeon]